MYVLQVFAASLGVGERGEEGGRQQSIESLVRNLGRASVSNHRITIIHGEIFTRHDGQIIFRVGHRFPASS